MDSKQHFIETTKTARYLTHGELSHKTQFIWFLLHGYAQSAEHLLESFHAFGDEHFFVVPEGLNHFYAKGFHGSPVASWMTSLMREYEIKDYIHYLNLVYNQFEIPKTCKIIVLGFSQGVSTLSRWVTNDICKPKHLVFIAGSLANELHQQMPEQITNLKNLYLYGDSDSLIDENAVQKTQLVLGESTDFIVFQGKHEINASCTTAISNWLNSI